MLDGNSENRMHGYKMKVLRGWKKTKSDIFGIILKKYERCVIRLKRCVLPPPRQNTSKRLSRTKLHPLPDKPIRRVASKLSRKPTNELERMRRKGDNWNANDLFRFQYGCFDGVEADELREICEEWLNRLYAIPKKYCYLAWYASAIYACFYRIAPLITDIDDKKDLWQDVKREYAEIMQMGRRIWRRPTHPSRLRVVYDLGMLCVRFNELHDDLTITLFRDLLADHNSFDFSVLNEVEYAQSIDKTVRLENHVIDLFFERRKSMLSNRSSIRSLPSSDRTPGNSFRLRRSRNSSDRSSYAGAAVSSPTRNDSFRAHTESKDNCDQLSPKSSFRTRMNSSSPRDSTTTLSSKNRKSSLHASRSEPSSPRPLTSTDTCEDTFTADKESTQQKATISASNSFRTKKHSSTKEVSSQEVIKDAKPSSQTSEKEKGVESIIKKTGAEPIKRSSIRRKQHLDVTIGEPLNESDELKNVSSASSRDYSKCSANEDTDQQLSAFTSSNSSFHRASSPTSPRSVHFAGDPFDDSTTTTSLNTESTQLEPQSTSSGSDENDNANRNDNDASADNNNDSSNQLIAIDNADPLQLSITDQLQMAQISDNGSTECPRKLSLSKEERSALSKQPSNDEKAISIVVTEHNEKF